MTHFIRWVILAGALASTGFAEYSLAAHLGWHWAIAATLPVVLDLYLVHAVRTGRDVAPAVLSVVAASATSYTVAHPIDTDTPIRIAVSCVAPLILWRLETTAKRERDARSAAEAPAPVAPTLAETHSVMHPALETLCDTEDESPTKEETSHDTPSVAPAPSATHDDTPVRLTDERARRMAEDAYATGVSARAAAPDVTRSAATVARWYREFADQGVKRLELQNA